MTRRTPEFVEASIKRLPLLLPKTRFEALQVAPDTQISFVRLADTQVYNFLIGPERPLAEQTTEDELDLIG